LWFNIRYLDFKGNLISLGTKKNVEIVPDEIETLRLQVVLPLEFALLRKKLPREIVLA